MGGGSGGGLGALLGGGSSGGSGGGLGALLGGGNKKSSGGSGLGLGALLGGKGTGDKFDVHGEKGVQQAIKAEVHAATDNIGGSKKHLSRKKNYSPFGNKNSITKTLMKHFGIGKKGKKAKKNVHKVAKKVHKKKSKKLMTKAQKTANILK